MFPKPVKLISGSPPVPLIEKSKGFSLESLLTKEIVAFLTPNAPGEKLTVNVVVAPIASVAAGGVTNVNSLALAPPKVKAPIVNGNKPVFLIWKVLVIGVPIVVAPKSVKSANAGVASPSTILTAFPVTTISGAAKPDNLKLSKATPTSLLFPFEAKTTLNSTSSLPLKLISCVEIFILLVCHTELAVPPDHPLEPKEPTLPSYQPAPFPKFCQPPPFKRYSNLIPSILFSLSVLVSIDKVMFSYPEKSITGEVAWILVLFWYWATTPWRCVYIQLVVLPVPAKNRGTAGLLWPIPVVLSTSLIQLLALPPVEVDVHAFTPVPFSKFALKKVVWAFVKLKNSTNIKVSNACVFLVFSRGATIRIRISL